MSEENVQQQEGWGTDYLEPPPKKRGLSKWAIGCSAGCLVTVIAVAVTSYFVLKPYGDEDVQWPRVAQVLPFDERPEYTIFGAPRMAGWDFWYLEDTGTGLTAWIAVSDIGGDEYDAAMRDDTFYMLAEPALSEGEITIQGTALACTRFYDGDTPDEVVGMTIALRQPGSEGGFLVVRMNATDVEGGIEDEDVAHFLAPFHVGPDR